MANGIFASNKPEHLGCASCCVLRRCIKSVTRLLFQVSGRGCRAARGGLARLNAPDAGKSPATLPPTTDCRR